MEAQFCVELILSLIHLCIPMLPNYNVNESMSHINADCRSHILCMVISIFTSWPLGLCIAVAIDTMTDIVSSGQ